MLGCKKGQGDAEGGRTQDGPPETDVFDLSHTLTKEECTAEGFKSHACAPVITCTTHAQSILPPCSLRSLTKSNLFLVSCVQELLMRSGALDGREEGTWSSMSYFKKMKEV